MAIVFDIFPILQEPVCSFENDCSRTTKIDPSRCLPPCSGLIITSFVKSEKQKDLDSLISQEIFAYDKYKKGFTYPSSLKG